MSCFVPGRRAFRSVASSDFAIFAGVDIFAFGFYTRREVSFPSDVSLRPWVVDDVPWVMWVLISLLRLYRKSTYLYS